MIINQKGNGTVVAGTITREPQGRMAGEHNVTGFSIRYGVDMDGQPDERGRKPAKYLDVDCWGELGIAAKRLQKGDDVIAAGTLTSREYNGKTYWTLRADAVCPGAIAAERFMMKAGEAAVDAFNPDKAPTPLAAGDVDFGDEQLPF